ncbi:ECF-type riboflavin transporter substrate-binding protein [Vagococcus hydrophili]|uniref:UPF0397 protein G7082_13720 n=1 Tax=Vagococcus hydrophili TaxID=2714947 RepID=A0A6G8AWX2_9ENTE|nr:ECF-type riboflavin transporter substrate-binding protein [Vagococcus hydrophili]QIL49480.1 ECF-type riboflavin transporter substrate-binding protein [Vagococcus hydrophili]
MKKDLSVKDIVAIGIGAAVFVILFRFIAIPSGMPNTELQVAYGFLALMGALFGPIPAALIGFIGHTIKDFTTYGTPWWSWIICSGLIGAIFGFIGKRFKLEEGIFTKKDMIYFNIGQILANAFVWGLVAPTLDVIIYAEPASKVYTQGVIGLISNSISAGVVGTLLMIAYASSRTKKGTLSKD